MRIDPTKRLSHHELETSIKEFTEPFPFTFTTEQTIGEILFVLQTKKVERSTGYLYVTDKENTLCGVINIADLVFNPPETQLAEIMNKEVIKVFEHETLEKGLKILADNQILVLPVVNQENRFIGALEMLHRDDFLTPTKKIHQKNLKQDIFQFIGFSIEQRKLKSPWMEYRFRMPWLLCSLAAGLICAGISEFYKLTIVDFVILAFFIPLVLGLSESIAIQSMTLSLRFLHIRKIHWIQVLRRLFIESKSSLLLGVTSALIIGIFYFIWSVEIKPFLSIGISVIASMMVSALFGGFFPILLRALNLDPKVAAGPLVLMMADIFTITIYLSLATFILR